MNNCFNAILTVNTSDPDDSRRRRLLNILLLGLTLVSTLTVVVAFISPLAQPQLRYLGLGLVFTNGIIYVINRYFSGTLASGIFLLLLILIISFGDAPEQVVQGRTLFFLSVPIVASSILMRPYTSFVVAGIISTLSAFLSVSANIPVNSVAILGFFTVASGTYISARSLVSALTDLRAINRDLDLRVASRTQELADANDRLQELDRLKSKFVSDVSHELRTPVSNLKIYLDIMEMEPNQEKSDTYFGVLKEETDRLTRLVEDVLDLAKLDMGPQIKSGTEVIDLDEIVKNLVSSQLVRTHSQRLDVQLNQTDQGSMVLGSQEQLTRIVTNLLGNAVKYTVAGSVNVSTRRENGEVILEIKDTGIGISEVDLEHIYERFYRGDNVGQLTVPGSGLGLAITRELVEALGGRIRVTSELNVGTVAKVYLPVVE